MTNTSHEDGSNITELHAIVEGTGLSSDVKRFVLARQWTLIETPSVETQAECEGYRRRRDAYGFVDWHIDGWAEWAKTPAGMQATALDARILEWDDR